MPEDTVDTDQWSQSMTSDQDLHCFLDMSPGSLMDLLILKQLW